MTLCQPVRVLVLNRLRELISRVAKEEEEEKNHCFKQLKVLQSADGPQVKWVLAAGQQQGRCCSTVATITAAKRTNVTHKK